MDIITQGPFTLKTGEVDGAGNNFTGIYDSTSGAIVLAVYVNTSTGNVGAFAPAAQSLIDALRATPLP